MRKPYFLTFLLSYFLTFLCSCTNYEPEAEVCNVTFNLIADETLPDGIVITAKSNTGNVYTTVTSSSTSTMLLPPALYEISVNKVDKEAKKIYSGSMTDVAIGGDNVNVNVNVNVSTMPEAKLIIKELYVGGCQKDDGSGVFHMDKCIILYNNTSEVFEEENICIGMVEPYNAEASSHNFLVNGELQYANEDWVPAINGIWYFQGTLTVQPYSEVVVAVNGAIDHTQTYSQSINYANADYYCMYDPVTTSSDGIAYYNTSYYPTPSSLIPASHYLKAVKYGQANAWPLSTTSPAVILFKADSNFNFNSNVIYPDGKSGNLVYACLKVPRSWVMDAVEVYNNNKVEQCKKRLTPDLDNGYVLHTNQHGHALIRNIDTDATATAGHNVYLDTNNSSNDFREADQCSLK